PGGGRMKPPMPYSGGKQVIAEKIVARIPPHEGYVEPFARLHQYLIVACKGDPRRASRRLREEP
ncbi:hypothetical protein, partial [Oribacterium sp. HCP3S3_B9]